MIAFVKKVGSGQYDLIDTNGNHICFINCSGELQGYTSTSVTFLVGTNQYMIFDEYGNYHYA